MKIILNGEERQVEAGARIESLLAELKLKADQVAVEVNRRLVNTSQYGRALNEGDEVEVVTFVGGG